MSVPLDGSSSSSADVKQHFVTREGYYRNLPAFEYSRPNRANSGLGASQQVIGPVKMCMFQVADDFDSGYKDRLMFNLGRETFTYVFKSIWEAPDLSRPVDRQIHKALPTCHDVNVINCSSQGCTMLVGFATGSFLITDSRRGDPHIFNEDRLLDKSKVTCVKWIPGSEAQFLVGFASGQLFHCDDSLPWITSTPSYNLSKHGDGFAVYTCKSRSTRNPLYRWLIGEGSLNAFAFSPCTRYLATVSHDGCLRVFSFATMDLLGSSRSYFGGLLCLSWSPDCKFICYAGEDDLVHLWSAESSRIVARGRGHKSWVTAVSFDPMTSCLTQDGVVAQLNSGGDGGDVGRKFSGAKVKTVLDPSFTTQRITTYRFASVGQDTQICLWELTDDVVKQSMPLRTRTGSTILTPPPTLPPHNPFSFPSVAPKPPKSEQNQRRSIPLLGGRFTTDKSASNHKPSIRTSSSATVQTTPVKNDKDKGAVKTTSNVVTPKLDDVPLLEPLVCKRIAGERLNDIVFHEDCILISTQEGIIMCWSRPGRPAPSESSRQNSAS